MAREYKFGKRVFKFNLKSDADKSVFSEIFLDRDYAVVDEIIRGAQNCVIDIGAHIGLFSMYVRGLNDGVKIFAYEPAPENFSEMKKHFKENDVEGVFAKNVAVGGVNGEMELFLSEDSHNHSLLNFFGDAYFKKIKVPTVNMEKIFEKDLGRNGVGFCDLVKMDCEGAEFEILEAMRGELFKKIGAFYIEYHEYSDGKNHFGLEEILVRNGFRVRSVKSRYDNKLGFIFARRGD